MKAFVDGKPITGQVHPLLQMFYRCEHMRFAHLPWPGSMSDQHPELFDAWDYIWQMKATAEKREREEQRVKAEREAKAAQSRSGRRR